MLQVGDYTQDDNLIFTVKEMKIRPYEYDDLIHLSISYEFNLDLYRVDREVYNMLDWLGDVGGLRDALFIIGGAIMSIRLMFRGDDLEAWLL